MELIGDKPALIDPRAIRDGVRRRGYGAAKEFLSCLRAVYRVAIEDGLVSSDPTLGIRAPRPKVEGWHTWTLEDCTAYEKRWPIGTKQRTAYAIGIYTAQRISDAVLLGRQHQRQGRLEFTQRKNQRRSPVRVVIPLVPPLAEALAGWQGTGLTFLETAYGRPFSSDGLSNAFRAWCDAAGLPHCTFHGLRKAAATRLAEAGATPHQIMAVLGHTTHQQAALYTRAADRAGVADDAMGRLYGEQEGPQVSVPGSVKRS